MTVESYLSPILQDLRSHANAELAAPMEKYMKYHFPYLGVKAPLRKELTKNFLRTYGKPAVADAQELIEYLWDQEEREFQYVGMDLLEKIMNKLPAEMIPALETILVKKAWWDTVDGISSNLIGGLLKRYPEKIQAYIGGWIESDNFWLNRLAILFQLKYKEKTDFALLQTAILPHIHQKEFFIRKAIGWALREYSKTNPEAVSKFVQTHALSNLSEREAMRIILKPKTTP